MFSDMWSEISGNVTNADQSYAKTLLNEAWEDVRRLGGWSFQFIQTGIAVPGLLGTGTVTLQFGNPVAIGDANATAAWATASIYGSLITQRQFRAGGVSGAGTMYNVIGYDTTTYAPFAALTLDRPFTDFLTSQTAPVTGQGYSIYQPYITGPCKDFRRFLSVLDIANAGWLWVRADRRSVDRNDPQRQIFSNPDRLLPMGQDTRPGSSTAGWPMFELWPGPQNQFLYQVWGLRFGAPLVNPTDELPIGIPESMIKAKARARYYEQAEANKDPANPRGAGADYRFLIGVADAQYKRELKAARLEDRDKVDIFTSQMQRSGAGVSPTTYNSATGAINAQVGV
jgi:hypothetical protein